MRRIAAKCIIFYLEDVNIQLFNEEFQDNSCN